MAVVVDQRREIVFAGDYHSLLRSDTLTGRYLRGREAAAA
jgi:hypothetical protein